jgi:hypothetical protein
MAFLTPPAQGDDVRELWRIVADCVDKLNALENMTASIEGPERMVGKFTVGAGSCELKFESSQQVGDLGG